LCLHRDRVPLSDRDLYTLIRSREYLPAQTFSALVDEVVPVADTDAMPAVTDGAPADAWDAAPDAAGSAGPPGRRLPVRLMLGGIVPEPMSLFDAIDGMGARVVADDLACGSRRLYRRTAGTDPYARLAESLMSGPPDPTLGAPIAERAAFITRRMRETGARGLLVYDVKFCEPELFDLPQLREHLSAQQLPMLHVEFESAPAIAQQTLNRIEAFVEMLQ
jgi:hypothetical protein